MSTVDAEESATGQEDAVSAFVRARAGLRLQEDVKELIEEGRRPVWPFPRSRPCRRRAVSRWRAGRSR
ncbi:hypothetical protein [uncultured Ornithinimicrobium sp.]|uniref:hypothetical protein n=1 Tax=uncultured Ornithinimicrobium sp. TaxID=259307 RepID=UPI0025927B8D|nr:hypothetical protein [uncultured Ornithinimicrobium sp.]